MLPAHVGASRSALAALQRDFARLRMLEHPHIARLLELGSNGQQHYVTAERLDGESLREVLSHLAPERLEVGEADDIVRAVGSALVYSHDHDIAHGDVRAENVLVTMDRRIVLTNYLARRVAKVPTRPPRPSDDLRGLARLAAELYIGSVSPQALRSAAHGDVPGARLNAIRSVLEPSGRRFGSVDEFLAAAGLAFSAAPAVVHRRAEAAPRTWSLWRLVAPAAVIAALVTFLAIDYAEVGASAQELTVRGLDALRAVAARVAPAESTQAGPLPSGAGAELSPAGTVDPEVAPAPAASDASPEADELAPGAHLPIAPSSVDPAATTAQREASVVSFGRPKVAAREDHSVVAIDIVRSGDTSTEAAVGWWTTPDTAHAEDDYANLGRQMVRFPAGATVERVLIPIVNDGLRESDEAFTVHLSRPRGSVMGAVAATRVTLHDDD
jgi:hypothetical protein